MKITEKCKVIVASSLVAALMTGTALPALRLLQGFGGQKRG